MSTEVKHFLWGKPTIESLSEEQRETFQELRERGLELIKEWMPDTWNDYNVHDPGIMLLELVCLTLVELGEKTQQEIRDLLASEDGNSNDLLDKFFMARHILPCNPVTEYDFQKVLMDHPGVRNVWVHPNQRNKLSLQTPTYQQKTVGGHPPHAYKGLYSIQVELEDPRNQCDHYQEDSSNNRLMVWETTEGGKRYRIEASFPSVYKASSTWRSKATIEKIDAKIHLLGRSQVVGSKFKVTLTVDWSGNGGKDTLSVPTRVVEIASNQTSQWASDPSEPGHEIVLEKSLARELDGLLEVFRQKAAHSDKQITNIERYLHAHRNLGEDFLPITPIHRQLIAVEARINVGPNADIDALLAKIFYNLQEFLAPALQPISLNTAQEEGKAVEKIFQGPLLAHGYIRDEALSGAQHHNALHLSDLVAIIMRTHEDILSLKDFHISSFINNQLVAKDANMILLLQDADIYKPYLYRNKSHIQFFQNALPLSVNKERVEVLFKEMRREAREKAKAAAGTLRLPLPVGEFQGTPYLSLQERFLSCYGIGYSGLVKSVSPERKAQARQLKGYLMFFDQILANAFSQVFNLRNLFALSPPERTYFSQPLYEIPRVQELLVGFDPDATNWKEFCEDNDNFYRIGLGEATEDLPTTVRRKSQLLDHLLARFSELYEDHSRLLDHHNSDSEYIEQYELKRQEKAIDNKIAFLKDYDLVSRDRGKAYNRLALDKYGKPDVWNTNNISGFERRVARLLGIRNIKRRSLNKGNDTDEGFHLVEHILLRPPSSTSTQASPKPKATTQIPESEDSSSQKTSSSPFESSADPYSLRVSVFFPNWPSRFSCEKFRRYVEIIVREQAPVHLLFYIYWLSYEEMQTFEVKYQAWLTAATALNPSASARQDFIQCLNQLTPTVKN